MKGKKLVGLLILVILLTALTACSLGPSDAECESALRQMSDSGFDLEPLPPMSLNMILNNNHAPDTVGHVLRECIENGWDGYR